MNEEETKEDNKKKKSKTTIIIIIVMLVIIAVIAGIIIYKLLNPKVVEEDKFKNVVRDTVSIEKLESFTRAGLYNDFNYKGLAYDFANGMKGLSNEQKNLLILQYLYYVSAEIEKVDVNELSDRYKNDPVLGDPNSKTQQLLGRSFEKQYEKFFGDSPKLDEKTLKESSFCPTVYKYDSRTRKIYLNGDCKEETDTLLVYKSYNYTHVDDYYYVYQYIGLVKPKKDGEEKNTYMKFSTNEVVEVDDFSGNEKLFETLIWKFDKDYNFISTTLS